MIQDDLSLAVTPYWRQKRSVPGHLYDIDLMLFDRLLASQQGRVAGDLVEIGAYLGKSAIVIGAHRGEGEGFVVCDVFEDQVNDSANEHENVSSYIGLTQQAFLDNYARFVERPPTVVRALSNTIGDHVGENTVRFAHIDGGHLYETVRSDLENALDYLKADGLVVMDDVRSVHTPGVAAATWEKVSQERLFPIIATEIKVYMSPSRETADRTVDMLTEWFSGHREVNYGRQIVRNRSMLIVLNPRIDTTRSRIRGWVPPTIVAKLKPSAPPYLGTRP